MRTNTDLRADDIRPYTDSRTGMVPTTQYHAKLRIGDKNLCTKQPIAEFWVRQGVGFCTRGSALCVRDRTGMVLTTQYHTKLRIGDPNLRTGEPIAEFWVRQGAGFCERWSARGCVTEFAWFSQRSIARNYALAILERLSLSIAIFSFSFLAASR